MPGGHIPEFGQSGSRWGISVPPDFREIQAELRKLDDKTFLKEIQSDWKRLLQDRVVPAVRARALAQNVPHEVPGTVRAGVDRKGPFVRAGGVRAPAAGVFEGTRSGLDRRHPVFAGRWPSTEARPEWKWVSQPKRPFLRPVAAEFEDELREEAGQSALKVLERAGLRRNP